MEYIIKHSDNSLYDGKIVKNVIEKDIVFLNNTFSKIKSKSIPNHDIISIDFEMISFYKFRMLKATTNYTNLKGGVSIKKKERYYSRIIIKSIINETDTITRFVGLDNSFSNLNYISSERFVYGTNTSLYNQFITSMGLIIDKKTYESIVKEALIISRFK